MKVSKTTYRNLLQHMQESDMWLRYLSGFVWHARSQSQTFVKKHDELAKHINRGAKLLSKAKNEWPKEKA